MNEAKQLEIKKIFKEKWGEITSKEIMEGFIFGPIATNEHYNVDEIEEVRLGLGKQIDVVVSEIRNKMNGSYVVTPQVIDLETGEITQKVGYFKVASKTALIDSLSCEDWEVEDILDEVMDGKTRTEFVKSFTA